MSEDEGEDESSGLAARIERQNDLNREDDARAMLFVRDVIDHDEYSNGR